MKAVLVDGKYEIEFNEATAAFKAKRYGEVWRDLTGDGMVLAMLYRIDELETALAQALQQPADQHALNPSRHPLSNQHSHLQEESTECL